MKPQLIDITAAEVTLLKEDGSGFSMSTSVAFGLLMEIEMAQIHDELLWIRDPPFLTWYTQREMRLDGRAGSYQDAAQQIIMQYGSSWREELFLKPASWTGYPFLYSGYIKAAPRVIGNAPAWDQQDMAGAPEIHAKLQVPVRRLGAWPLTACTRSKC